MPPDEHKVGIAVSGRLFGGLAQDVRTKLPFFVSDFTDFFRGRFSQSLAATVLPLLCQSDQHHHVRVRLIIHLQQTILAVMEKMFEGQMGAIENILCCAISGVIFGLFSGQPLNVLSATGPTLIFEGIIYGPVQKGRVVEGRKAGSSSRFASGWAAGSPSSCWWLWPRIGVLLVAFITRFTEEAFSTLIAVVFIIQAVERVWHIQAEAPMTRDPLVSRR
ncbi:Anion exchange protein [Aphelenchoides fujianensis]|nr:Anion exchange protein [Aphelenchoides fujianensis]